MHVLMAKLQLDSVETVTLHLNQRKLNCIGASVRMVELVPPMMPVTWFADVGKISKEPIVMNTFQGVESIPVLTQVPLYQLSSFLSASSSVLDFISSSKRNRCKLINVIIN